MLTNGVIVRFRSGLRPDTIRRYVEMVRKGDLHLLLSVSGYGYQRIAPEGSAPDRRTSTMCG